MSNALDLRDASTLLVDIGGGSVELVLAENGVVKLRESLKLGVLRLAERFFEHDPPQRDELEALEEYLDRQLGALAEAPARCRGAPPGAARRGPSSIWRRSRSSSMAAPRPSACTA